MNPIVSQLWEQRQELKQQGQSPSSSRTPPPPDMIHKNDSKNTILATENTIVTKKAATATFKNPSSSKTTIDYEFSSDEFLREAYRSPGGTIRESGRRSRRLGR
mmetsp:Transcript_18354/g.27876  ORF Transcript_18354/g.27876 Transcript_18354/m.27876 type:complete len:104 (+) Transcript_18354:488-799(+)